MANGKAMLTSTTSHKSTPPKQGVRIWQQHSLVQGHQSDELIKSPPSALAWSGESAAVCRGFCRDLVDDNAVGGR